MKRTSTFSAVMFTAFVLCAVLVSGCTKATPSVDVSTGVTVTTGTTTITTTTTSKVLKSEKVSYDAPNDNKEAITVTLELDANNTITKSDIIFDTPSNPKSAFFQGKFMEGISAQLQGKTLSNAKVGIINGASLSSAAFNKALETLKS